MLTAIFSPASSALAVCISVARQRRQQSQLGEAEGGSGGIQQHLGPAMKDGQKGRDGGDRQVQGIQAESLCRSREHDYELQQL